MKIEHAGKFECNAGAECRLRVSFRKDGLDVYEMEALAAPFLAEMREAGVVHFLAPGIEFAIFSRREFALVPQMIRRFEAMGFVLGVFVPRLDDHGFKSHTWSAGGVDFPSKFERVDPALVWREIALAQMFYHE